MTNEQIENKIQLEESCYTAENKVKFYSKLLAFQKIAGSVSKTSKNPFTKKNYFDINELLRAVKPVLNKVGLVLTQPIRAGYVVSELTDPETGYSIMSSLKLSDTNNPQNLGSEITYYRRYTSNSLLSLEAEDDDANKTRKAPLTDSAMKKVMKQISDAKDTTELNAIQAKLKMYDMDQVQEYEISEAIKNK